jgi:hypothetical protein
MSSADNKTQHAVTSEPAAAPRAQRWADPFQENNRVVFESDQVPATDRVDMTRDLAWRLFGGIDLLPTNDPGFRAGMWASRDAYR